MTINLREYCCSLVHVLTRTTDVLLGPRSTPEATNGMLARLKADRLKLKAPTVAVTAEKINHHRHNE